MYPSRNPYFSGNAPANSRSPRSISISSGRSYQPSPAPMMQQQSTGGQPLQLNQAEASRPILGRSDSEDHFPMETVNRIFNDIEGLFVEDSNYPPSKPSSTSVSGLAYKYFPANQSTSESNPSNNSMEQNINLCSNELTALDALVSGDCHDKMIANSPQVILGGKNYLQPHLLQSQLSNRSFDGLAKAPAMSLSYLHSFVNQIFSVHDKLQAFIQMHSKAAISQQQSTVASEQNIIQIFEKWRSLGEILRDRLNAVNSFPELTLTMAAIQPKQAANMLRLTRLLRAFVCERKNQAAAAANRSNSVFAPNQKAYKHQQQQQQQYQGNYGDFNNNNSSSSSNFYFG